MSDPDDLISLEPTGTSFAARRSGRKCCGETLGDRDDSVVGIVAECCHPFQGDRATGKRDDLHRAMRAVPREHERRLDRHPLTVADEAEQYLE